MSKNVYHIGSGALTFEIIERIINENLKLELAPEAKLRIQKCRDYLDQKIASSEEPLYGITTGFGSLCTKNISPDELGTLQENLIKSHACSVGEEIRPVIIKLMMLLKAHALSLGHSGVQVITVQRILDFFNNDVMPIVYDRGSLGASGDLAPLANLFLPLIGVGDVYYKGKKCEAISVLDEFGWEPVKLMSKEGLALLNGTQFMSANGVFAMLKAFRLSKKADLIAALSLEAFDGRIDPFMDCIQQIRPHQGQIETGETFRKLLAGSELIERHKEHVQDPYSFRCIPQVHGATKDAIRYVASVLLTEINSVTDNPTIFPDEDAGQNGADHDGGILVLGGIKAALVALAGVLLDPCTSLHELGVVLHHHLGVGDQHLAGGGIHHVANQVAAADAVRELLDHLTVFADAGDLDAVGHAAVLLPDDDVLRKIVDVLFGVT